MQMVKISADGAGLEYKPDIIIGDLDSTKLDVHVAQYIRMPDQSTTDFEKCLHYVRTHKIDPSLILGIAGGEIDHTLNNIMIMSSCNTSYFIDYLNEQTIKYGRVVKKEENISLPLYSSISIIPLLTANVSTKGLKWNLSYDRLNYKFLRSVRNLNTEEHVCVKVHKGTVLLIISVPIECLRRSF